MHWDTEPKFELLLDVDFSDIEHMCESVKSWNLDFRPLRLPRNGDGAGRIIQARSGPVEYGYARILQSIEQFGDPPADLFTFIVPGKSLNQLWWRGHEVSRQTILVFHVGSELYSLSGPDFEVYTFSISEELIGAICEDLELKLPDRNMRSEVFQVDHDVLAELQSYLPRMTGTGGVDASFESRWIVELLVTAWLSAPGLAPQSSRRGRDAAMKKCLAMIEKFGWEDLTPAGLCRAVGVSERTLQYAFRERFGVTPAAFLKARRLNAIRKKLRDPFANSAIIGEIASEFGFWHQSQFAADYRRAFGEVPSATLLNSKR